MATRSIIIHALSEVDSRAIYCHSDGYPDHHLPILTEHYNTDEKVSALMDLGDLSSLAKNLRPFPEMAEFHSFSDPLPDVCVAYGPDRGDKKAKAAEGSYLSLVHLGSNVAYVYVFYKNKWYYKATGSRQLTCAGGVE